MKVVIADAGPLIGLARIDQLALLPGLFDQVWITDVIAAEIGLAPAPVDPQSYPGLVSLQLSCQQGWLQIAPAIELEQHPYRPINPGVDAGEASAIGLALGQQAAGQSVLLVVEDLCGRAEARQQGLAIMGTAAVLVLAKERGLVATCSPLLRALREQGYYLSDALVAAVRKQAQEDEASDSCSSGVIATTRTEQAAAISAQRSGVSPSCCGTWARGAEHPIPGPLACEKGFWAEKAGSD